MTHGPIGLDIGAGYIAAVQLMRARGGATPAVRAAVRFERTRPGQPFNVDEAYRIMDVLDRQGFLGQVIVTALPLHKQVSGVMELPSKASGAPVQMLARAEIARTHRFDAARVQAACWELPVPAKARPTETSPVMAVGCTITDAEALIQPLIAAGADVAALDARCVAVSRGAGLLSPGATGPTLALALDLEMEASLLVVTVDGFVVYERVLPEASMGGLLERVATKHKLEPAMARVALIESGRTDEAGERDAQEWAGLSAVRTLVSEFAADIGREISVSSGYAGQRFPQVAGQETKAHLVLTGDGARMTELARRIAERAGVSVDHARSAPTPGLCTALGLAMHSLPVSAPSGVNLSDVFEEALS